MLRCTWGTGWRTWVCLLNGGVGHPRVGGVVGGFPTAQRPVRFGSWGARKGCGAAELPGRRGRRGLAEQFPLDGFVPRDVLLYQYERDRFFRNVGLFCFGQFFFWVYLAQFAFSSLRDTSATASAPDPQQKDRPPQTAWGGMSLNLGSNKWRFGFTASCLTVGTLILVAGFFYARRSVKQVLLLRGGQEAIFTTYYPFGFTSSFTVPLRQMSCMSHRSEVAAIIPVKITGKPFYFLLDKEGSIPDKNLFDITVGAFRKL